MAYDGLVCTSCGSKQVVSTNGLFSCSFCKSNVVPRLIPGSLCNDLEDGSFCSRPAESICTACGRPLCELHNDPATLYWQTGFQWHSCCPEWSESAGRAWDIVSNPQVSLPVTGFEPFPWVEYEKKVLFKAGEIEYEVAEALKALVNPLGGDFYERGVRFTCICGICEAELDNRISGTVDTLRERYRKVAYQERLKAIGAEIKQGIRYVEAFLEVSISEVEQPEQPVASLSVSSAPDSWNRCAAGLKRRFSAARRLSELLKSTKGSRISSD